MIARSSSPRCRCPGLRSATTAGPKPGSSMTCRPCQARTARVSGDAVRAMRATERGGHKVLRRVRGSPRRAVSRVRCSERREAEVLRRVRSPRAHGGAVADGAVRFARVLHAQASLNARPRRAGSERVRRSACFNVTESCGSRLAQIPSHTPRRLQRARRRGVRSRDHVSRAPLALELPMASPCGSGPGQSPSR